MRKPGLIILGVLALAAGMWWFLAPPDRPTSGTSGNLGKKTVARDGQPARRAPSADGLRGATPASGAEDHNASPPLEAAATEADGAVLVRVTANDRALAHASVRLYWQGRADPNTGVVDWRAAGSGTTGEDGKVRLLARPGTYLVAARREHFSATRLAFVRPHGEPLTQVTVVLQAGFPLNGRTLQQDRTPLALAELTLTQHAAKDAWRHDAPPEERIHVRSDPNGAFRVENLAPGAYQLDAIAPGFAATTLRRVSAPRAEPLEVLLHAAAFVEGKVKMANGAPAAEAVVIVTGGSEQLRVATNSSGAFSADVAPGRYSLGAQLGDQTGALPAPVTVAAGVTKGGLVITLGEQSAISGVVFDAAGKKPLAGAAVDVSPHNEFGDSGRTLSGPDGRFVVAPLPPGTYDVGANATGYSEETKRGLVVGLGQRFPIEIALRRTGNVAGVVSDAVGSPLPNALVSGGTRYGGPFGPAAAETRTDAAGRYTLSDIEADKVTITAKRDGTQCGATKLVEVKAAQTARADFALDAPGTLAGVVKHANGASLSGPARVTAVVAKMGGMELAVVDTDPLGFYSLTLTPGKYRVGVSSGAGERWSDASRRVTIEAGKTANADLTLSGADNIAGVVLEPDGSPSRAAMVYYGPLDPESQGDRRISSVDDDGTFTFTPMTDAQAVLRASAGGRTSSDKPLAGHPSGEPITLQLRPGATLHGKVSGDPPPASIAAFVTNDRYVGFNEDALHFLGAELTLQDVAPGPTKVRVQTPDGRTGQAALNVLAGEINEVRVTLSAGANVRGRILDPDKKTPKGSVLVRLGSAWEFDAKEDETTDDGKFELSPVPPGKHTLTAIAVGYKTERTIHLAEGQTLDLGDLVLELQPIK